MEGQDVLGRRREWMDMSISYSLVSLEFNYGLSLNLNYGLLISFWPLFMNYYGFITYLCFQLCLNKTMNWAIMWLIMPMLCACMLYEPVLVMPSCEL